MTTPAYTSVSRLYQVVPMVGSLTDVTSSILCDVFIGDAEALMNIALARSYTIPLSVSGATFPALQAIATDLAIYRVLSRRVFTQEQLKNSTWPDRFKEAMLQLDALASGSMLLITSSGDVVADRTDIAEVWSNTQGYIPTMSELPEEFSKLDSDKQDDLLSDRDIAIDNLQ